MRKRLLRILILIALTGTLWWFFGRPDSPDLHQIVERAGDALQETAKEVSAPPPLRAEADAPSSTLTKAGVLTWTNIQRRDNGGLPPLTVNAKLEAAAKAKLDDLFARQYFEHVSPDGIGPADLATRAGYAYIVIGENLALGNFKDDQALVQAWMDSPGHRANILGKDYVEIGIAVGRGTYEGHSTWIAVQEFGRPVSACPSVDASLKAKIDADEAEHARLVAEAQALKAELDSTKRPRTQEERDAYNAKVEEYNALVGRINALTSQIQGEITVYNGQVQAYNACANG